MSHPAHSLDAVFKPRSVAVVGASGTPGSVGSILVKNLLENPFGGVVYPVNPRRKAVHGVLCYPDLMSVPEGVDLAVIATPAFSVPGVVQQCVERGVKAGIIVSAGFAELGVEGRALEGQVRAAARGKMRIIGPNCLGVLHPPSNLNASFAATMARPGQVALLSQSGAVCTSVLDWAATKHIGFSTFVSMGSMIDVDFADLIDYFADDAATRSIILYMESVGDVRKFLSAARSVSRAKQIIVVKAGRYDAGARAAASHTGALAGADAVFEAAFRRAGVLRVTTIPDLFHMSEILAMQPQPKGAALAIVTNAGGPGVMATDALIADGGHLATFSPRTVAALNAALPPFWSHANPVDLLGDATPDRYRVAVQACLEDHAVQGLLILLTPQAMTDPAETARMVAPLGRGAGKPVLGCWMGGAVVGKARELLNEAGIPTFDAPEAAVRAFLHMVQYKRNQELLYETPPAMPEDWKPDTARMNAIVGPARADGRTLLNEVESKEVLAAYGIPVVPTVACRSPEEAVAAADRIGYPVVCKLLSTKVTHKSDAGGVQLDLPDAAAVRAAFTQIRARTEKSGGAGAFDGIAVQPMVRDRGYELILGSSIDPQFGPVILFGSGGVLVEVLRDRALALPPLNRTLARRLMERTKIHQALRGVRGQQAVDLAALETLLARFSQLVIDAADVREIDVNPLLATPERLVALDARVLLAPADSPPGERKLAIRPYPNQYTASHRLRDGTEVTVRAIRPEDEPLIIDMHGQHSEHTIRMRYFSLVKTLSHESLIRLCHLDYEREMALIAVKRDGAMSRAVGVSRYYLNPETGIAEFALIVSDAYQRLGLGRHLLGRLLEVARESGVRTLAGLILAENAPMIALVRSMGFGEPADQGEGVVRVEMKLGGGVGSGSVG